MPFWSYAGRLSMWWSPSWPSSLTNREVAYIGHAVAWFGAPVADGAINPRRHRNSLGTNRSCLGSEVHDEADGVVRWRSF